MSAKQTGGDDAKDLDFSVPLSSATLWRYLFGGWYRRRGLRPVAVVFELPASSWPIDVYLDVRSDMAAGLLENLRGARVKGLQVSDEALEFVSSAALSGWGSDLEAKADGPAALGGLLRSWLASGARAWSRYDETVEILIRTPIPMSAVHRFVPLSQTNIEAKARRQAETRLWRPRDDDR